MPYPDDVLAPQEKVLLHFRPQRAAVLSQAIAVIIGLIAALVFLFLVVGASPDGLGQLTGLLFLFLVLLMVAVRCLVELARILGHLWFTHYLVTTDRVAVHRGMLNRRHSEIPLLQVSKIDLHQPLMDRIGGLGELRIEPSAGTEALRFTEVERPREVRAEIYRLISERTRSAGGDQANA